MKRRHWDAFFAFGVDIDISIYSYYFDLPSLMH